MKSRTKASLALPPSRINLWWLMLHVLRDHVGIVQILPLSTAASKLWNQLTF
jgi:hypothetical protein